MSSASAAEREAAAGAPSHSGVWESRECQKCLSMVLPCVDDCLHCSIMRFSLCHDCAVSKNPGAGLALTCYVPPPPLAYQFPAPPPRTPSRAEALREQVRLQRKAADEARQEPLFGDDSEEGDGGEGNDGDEGKEGDEDSSAAAAPKKAKTK
jgi:hypothetical protein